MRQCRYLGFLKGGCRSVFCLWFHTNKIINSPLLKRKKTRKKNKKDGGSICSRYLQPQGNGFTHNSLVQTTNSLGFDFRPLWLLLLLLLFLAFHLHYWLWWAIFYLPSLLNQANCYMTCILAGQTWTACGMNDAEIPYSSCMQSGSAAMALSNTFC
jgi:hypothetical protein